MTKLITISLISILFFGCSEQSNEKDELLSKIEELQKSNHALQKKNDSLSTLIGPPNVEIIDVKEESRETSTTNLNMSGSNSQNPSQGQVLKEGETVTIRIQEEVTDYNPTEPSLTDDKPDENVVPNPGFYGSAGFGGSNGTGNGGNEFSVGFSNGNPGSGSSMGNGEGKDYGDPKRENNPKPPYLETDFSGNVCVELLIDDRGAAISAKSCNSTTHPEEAVIDSVVLYIAKHIRFKAEKGAPNRKAFYTVYIEAG